MPVAIAARASAEDPKPDAPPKSTPKVASAFLESLLGSWDVVLQSKGEVTNGVHTFARILDGTAILDEYHLGEDSFDSLGVMRVAEDGKTVSYWSYDSGGDGGVRTFKGTIEPDAYVLEADVGGAKVTKSLRRNGDTLAHKMIVNGADRYTETWTKSAEPKVIPAPTAGPRATDRRSGSAWVSVFKAPLVQAALGVWTVTGTFRGRACEGVSRIRLGVGGYFVLEDDELRTGDEHRYEYRISSVGLDGKSTRTWLFSDAYAEPISLAGTLADAVWTRKGAHPPGGEMTAAFSSTETVLVAVYTLGAVEVGRVTYKRGEPGAVPSDRPAVEPFPGRGGFRNLRGGSKQTDDAVERALRWLAAHQSQDGGWECEGFARWCDGKPTTEARPDGTGKAQYDVGVTGLALLAFLGDGYTDLDSGPFGKVVANGLRYLKTNQDSEGCFGVRATGHFIYNHAIASLAMVEAYGMTRNAVRKGPAQKALEFIATARNPYSAWRYGVKPGDNDTSVTGWMMMALKSARLINAADVRGGRPPSLVIDEDAFEDVKAWVEKMTDPDYGRVGYQVRGTGPSRPTDLMDTFPSDRSESMTAVGMLARLFLGESPKTSKDIQNGARLCEKLLPTWNPADGSIDMYYWYYATLAMFQVGGDSWTKWERALKAAAVGAQRMDGDFCMYKGSWDPIDPWGGDGGRVYSTAMMALCLEAYFRYPRIVGGTGDGR